MSEDSLKAELSYQIQRRSIKTFQDTKIYSKTIDFKILAIHPIRANKPRKTGLHLRRDQYIQNPNQIQGQINQQKLIMERTFLLLESYEGNLFGCAR